MKNNANILLLILIVLLTLNLFSGKNKESQAKTWVKLEQVSNYKIPAKVKFLISNYTQEEIKINTCNDLKIKSPQNDIILDNCGDISIKSNSNYSVDFTSKFRDFYNIWEYKIILKNDKIEAFKSFEINKNWIVKKLFVTIFYAPIYNLMIGLLKLTNYSLWLSIITITLILKIALIYPQHKMMVNQKKMQIIQPKIKELQEKHKWDHQTIWMELMNLYKEHQVNPMWTMWLMMIQMPVLIVMYNVIAGIQDISGTFYLYPFFWDYKIESIKSFFMWIDLFGKWWINGLIFALVVWVLQFMQMYLSMKMQKKDDKKPIVLEKKKNIDDLSIMPTAEMMNKSMLISMPIMVWFFTYSFFLWVGLYWAIWTLFMIVQQIFVNKILKK